MSALILAHDTHSIAGHLSKRFRAIGTLSLQVKQPAALKTICYQFKLNYSKYCLISKNDVNPKLIFKVIEYLVMKKVLLIVGLMSNYYGALHFLGFYFRLSNILIKISAYLKFDML